MNKTKKILSLITVFVLVFAFTFVNVSTAHAASGNQTKVNNNWTRVFPVE